MGVVSKSLHHFGDLVYSAGESQLSRKRVFPLPLPGALEAPSALTFSTAKARERYVHRCTVHKRVIGTIRTLNELNASTTSQVAGRSMSSTSSGSSGGNRYVTSCQASILKRIWRCHVLAHPPHGADFGRAALNSLVKCRDLFALEASTVAGYDASRVNIIRNAETRQALVNLDHILGGDELKAWRNPEKYMLLSPEDQQTVHDSSDVPRPYTDPKLGKCDDEYLGFLRKLQTGGLLGFSKSVRGHVGCFFCS